MAVYKVHFAHPVEGELFQILKEKKLRGFVMNGDGKTVCGVWISPYTNPDYFHYAQQRVDPLPTTNKWGNVTCRACLRGRKKFEYPDGFGNLLEILLRQEYAQKQLEMLAAIKQLSVLQGNLEKMQGDLVAIHSRLEKAIESQVKVQEFVLPDYSVDKLRVLEE